MKLHVRRINEELDELQKLERKVCDAYKLLYKEVLNNQEYYGQELVKEVRNYQKENNERMKLNETNMS